MDKHPEQPKIKRLKVAVRGYTEGFTGVLSSQFEELASRSKASGDTRYMIDFLSRTITPSPDPPVSEDFFEFRNLAEWLQDVGSSLSLVRRFQMWISFDHSTLELPAPGTTDSSDMCFTADTEIEAVNGNVYRHHHECSVSFDWPVYIPGGLSEPNEL